MLMKKIKDRLSLILCGLAIGIVNGFFGGGGGMICVPLLEKFLKIDNKKSHSTTLAVMLPIALFSIIVYLIRVPMEWPTFGYVCSGFVAGGAIGALLLKNLSRKIVRIVFILVVLAAGVRMLI